jgi:hypothetical protein
MVMQAAFFALNREDIDVHPFAKFFGTGISAVCISSLEKVV